MQPPFDPVIIEIGPLTLRWYGLLIMLGILAGTHIASLYVASKGESRDNVWDMLLWVLPVALLGARIYYVFIQSPRGIQGMERYLQNPLEIFYIWQGGLHIFGGFLFGGFALYLFARIRKLNLPIYLDGIALGLPLAQVIGRQANFINQELYGPPTDFWLGLQIATAHRVPPYNDTITYPEEVLFHPLFLYESFWNLIGFILLILISQRLKNWLRPGDLALMYLFWYPVGRFFIEFLRTDSWFFPHTPFNVVHILTFVTFILAVVALYRHHTGDGKLRLVREPRPKVPKRSPTSSASKISPTSQPSKSNPASISKQKARGKR